MSLQYIKIKFKAFDGRILDRSVAYVVNAVKKIGGVVCGPIPLPTKIEKFTVNRSPHVYKKARDQFERRHHTRLLIIMDISSEIIDELSKLELSPGVGVEIEMIK